MDHSCISHYIKTHQDLMDTDYLFREKCVIIENEFVSKQWCVESKLKAKLEERKEINREIARLRTIVEIKKSYKSEVDLASAIC